MIDDKNPSRLATVIIPAQTKDTNIPLYIGIGLSQKQSDSVYFEMVENILPKCETNAEALRAIIDHPKWGPVEKVWAAFNLDRFAIENAKLMKNRKDVGFFTGKLLQLKDSLNAKVEKRFEKE